MACACDRFDNECPAHRWEALTHPDQTSAPAPGHPGIETLDDLIDLE